MNELSHQEWRVLRLIVEAHTNQYISMLLNIVLRTVEKHLSSIYRKLNMTNRAGAIKWYWHCYHQA